MKRYIYIIGIVWLSFIGSLNGYAADEGAGKHDVEMADVWDNWYVQLGLDMSLQNPYGYDLAKVFPNGKTFGVNAAIGRWFTPGLGLRGKVNWENGIPLFENGHANWLAPMYQCGVNMERGGYLALYGDIQLDIHNLFLGYDKERMWNLQVYPRAGVAYNFGSSKGTPVLGVGIGNTFRINERLGIYLDAAYQMVSSGFIPVGTGTGSNSNGYFDFNVGVQVNLGKRGFKAQAPDEEAAVIGSFWKGWFVQAGLDMNLQTPYGKNLSQVFPKGKTFGLDVAVGKHFSPEVALRARLNWENGFPLFENGHLEWVGPAGRNGINMDKGGYVAAYMDVLLNVHSLFMGYDATRKWHAVVFPRAGLISNRATKSGSPMVGAGVGTTYRLNERWSLYSDLAFQMTTSEFTGGVGPTGMSVSTGFNGILDFHIGVQLDL